LLTCCNAGADRACNARSIRPGTAKPGSKLAKAKNNRYPKKKEKRENANNNLLAVI